MRLSTEALLMLVAVALYLFDSLLLLASNEAVLVRGRRGRWFARFGLDRWRLNGKEPYLSNPATPHFPLWRLRWSFDEAAGEAAARARAVAVPPVLERFRLHALLSLISIYVLVPIVLFYPVGIGYPIAVVALLYINIVVALMRLLRLRAEFRLSPGQFAVLAFECMACPPFSVNLVRKLCMKLEIDEDFTMAAIRLLSAEALPAVEAQCLRRVDEQIDYAEEGSDRMQKLVAGRRRFVDSAPL